MLLITSFMLSAPESSSSSVNRPALGAPGRPCMQVVVEEDGMQNSLGKSHGKLEDAFVRSKKCTTGTKYMPGNMQRLDKGGVFGQKSASGPA